MKCFSKICGNLNQDCRRQAKVPLLIIAMIAVIGFGVTACDNILGSKDDDDSSAEYGWYGKGSANTFTINNFTQLAELAKIVNGSTVYDGPAQSDFKGKTVTLSADIDMSGKSWNGIGSSYTSFSPHPFNGTFDGNNKTISGLHTGNQGFFGLIGENGIVKNLVFVDLSVNGSDGAGGLTRTNRGKIQNININGSGNGSSIGGVVCFNYGIVENCNFSGTITSNLGGASGIANSNYTSGVVRNCYVTGSVNGGGIVDTNFGTVQNCYTTCSATRGGIAASNINGGTIKNCYATGNITGPNSVGGVVGDNGNGMVQNCYATGNVNGTYSVGGITGSNGTVQNCVALNPSITASTTNPSLRDNTGRVRGGGSSSLLNNYGSSGMTLPSFVTVTSNANGIHGTDVLASDYNSQTWWTTAVNWDFTTVWQWDSTRNLPKLRMQ